MKYRVIFDRSVFHGDGFHKLKNSGLSNLISQKVILVFFNTVFWEESLKYVVKSREEAKEQFKFLFTLDTKKWFRKAEDIINLELRNLAGSQRYYLFSKQEVDSKINDFKDILNGDLCIKKALEENKKVEAGKQARVKWLQQVRRDLSVYSGDFNKYYKEAGDILIERMFLRNREERAIWLEYRERCVFLERFARAFSTLIFLAQSDHCLRIDKNDRNDAEQLAFLSYADVFVSNDKRYMKKAFGLLYPGRGKHFLDLDGFLLLLSNI